LHSHSPPHLQQPAQLAPIAYPRFSLHFTSLTTPRIFNLARACLSNDIDSEGLQALSVASIVKSISDVTVPPRCNPHCGIERTDGGRILASARAHNTRTSAALSLHSRANRHGKSTRGKFESQLLFVEGHEKTCHAAAMAFARRDAVLCSELVHRMVDECLRVRLAVDGLCHGLRHRQRRWHQTSFRQQGRGTLQRRKR
jgi:hypothetical protein